MAKRLLILNGAAILCVVCFHAAGFGFTAMFSWAHRYRPVTSPNYDEVGTAAYYVLRLVEQLVAFSIPAFLFTSGFFVSVLSGRNRSVNARAIGSRIRNLIVPYLIWSSVVLTLLALQGRVFSESRYLRLLLTGSSNPNYYYVPLLVQFYVVAPLIVFAARRRWKELLIVTGLVQVIVYLLQYLVVVNVQIPIATTVAIALPKWLFLAQLFWFTFGAVAGFQQQSLKPVLNRLKPLLVPGVAALFVMGVIEWELLLRWSGNPWIETRLTLVDGLYSAALILTFLAYTDIKVPFSDALVALGGRSYGIYLVHGVVMEYAARGMYHFAPWVLARQLLLQPTLIAVGIAVPLALMIIVSRSTTRALYPYLFG